MRSALLTIFAHISKLLVGFLLLKLISFYLGADGLGRLGHFMSLLTILSILAGGGILNGVIKYVAEYRNHPFRLISFISAAASYSLIFAFLLFALGIIFSKSIARIILGDTQFYPYIIALALSQIGLALTNIVVGVSNGLRQNHIYAKIQIIGSLLALPLCWALIANWNLDGAIAGLISSLFAPTLPALYFCINSKISGHIKISPPSNEEFRKLSSFTLMLLTSAIAFPTVEILIRQHLINTSGYQEAGLWQAATRLSSAYVGIFSVFLAYWFMPIISAEKSWLIIRRYVFRLMLFTTIIFPLGAAIFYVWRTFFISILLSNDFLALKDLFIYQLIGDFFKVNAYIIGFVGVAKAMTKIYIGAELFQSLLFLSLFISIRELYSGAQGVMIGYVITYFAYFLVSLMFFLFFTKRAS